MLTPRRWASNLTLGFVLVAGCTPSTTPSPSMQPSVAATSTASAGSGPLVDCEPIELRDPSGERINLGGRWDERPSPDRGNLMTWWLHTRGACVWGAGYVDEVFTDSISATPDQVQSLSGRLGSDFTITGEIIWLGPLPPQAPGSPIRDAPLRMFIEFGEEGEILLREDREAGVRGPHCPDPNVFCPDPLVLEQVER